MRSVRACVLAIIAVTSGVADAELLMVTAEGLLDADVAAYRSDPDRMLQALRRDARARVVEKAVTALVEGSAVRRHYGALQGEVFADADRLIRRVIDAGEPRRGGDGFMHLVMRAEVDLGAVRERLDALSTRQRIELIRARGDPAIGVVVIVQDADQRAAPAGARSQIAENILKDIGPGRAAETG